MTNVFSDVLATENVLNKSYDDYHDRVYFRSNEDLDAVFSHFDVKEKNVLSVLGSGDQAFHLIKRGAKSIDLFDKNKLTIYYFYLRLWTIRYTGKYYPDVYFNHEYIKKLLSCVKPESEEEKNACEYWKMFTDLYHQRNPRDMFLVEGPIMNELDDVSLVNQGLKDKKICFYNWDISKLVDVDKQYDLIYLSNVHEWICGSISITVSRNNLYKLLKDNGIIICSNLTQDGARFAEMQIFSKFFNYYELPSSLVRGDYEVEAPGYFYTKKKLSTHHK